MALRAHKTRQRGQVFSKNQGCPHSKNNSVWCYGVCTPVDGHGTCGRLAHTVLRGRTQRAIAMQLERDDECYDLTLLDAPELWRRNGSG